MTIDLIDVAAVAAVAAFGFRVGWITAGESLEMLGGFVEGFFIGWRKSEPSRRAWWLVIIVPGLLIAAMLGGWFLL